MLQGLFGNETVEEVLYFLQVNGEGNATQISKTIEIALSMVQKQLKRLEDGGIVVCKTYGRTKQYYWNPRNILINDIRNLIESALNAYSSDKREQYIIRNRPRREGKPL